MMVKSFLDEPALIFQLWRPASLIMQGSTATG